MFPSSAVTLSEVAALNVTNEYDRLPEQREFHAKAAERRRTLVRFYLGGIGVSGATGDYWQNGGQDTVGTLYFGGSGAVRGGTYIWPAGR